MFVSRSTTYANPSRLAHRSRLPHPPRLFGDLSAKPIITMETPVRDIGAPGSRERRTENVVKVVGLRPGANATAYKMAHWLL